MADPPSEEETRLWRRRLGSAANSRGWALSEQSSRTPQEDAEMLHAAHAARHLWSTIGTAGNFALGDLTLPVLTSSIARTTPWRRPWPKR